MMTNVKFSTLHKFKAAGIFVAYWQVLEIMILKISKYRCGFGFILVDSQVSARQSVW